MIFEIFPKQFFSEQNPAALVRPFFITIRLTLDINPYFLHFKQSPLIDGSITWDRSFNIEPYCRAKHLKIIYFVKNVVLRTTDTIYD